MLVLIGEKLKKQYKDNQEPCSICFNSMNEECIILKCSHVFHESCLWEWVYIKQECPSCKKKIWCILLFPFIKKTYTNWILHLLKKYQFYLFFCRKWRTVTYGEVRDGGKNYLLLRICWISCELIKKVWRRSSNSTYLEGKHIEKVSFRNSRSKELILLLRFLLNMFAGVLDFWIGEWLFFCLSLQYFSHTPGLHSWSFNWFFLLFFFLAFASTVVVDQKWAFVFNSFLHSQNLIKFIISICPIMSFNSCLLYNQCAF